MEVIKLSKKICFLVTDAISFNVLFRDQLEYIRDRSDFDITLICGGNKEQLDILRKREIGDVINAKFHRQPSLFNDAKSLIYLTRYLLLNRFDIVVYSTPKALLLGSIAGFLSMQNKKIAVVHGRVYENFTGSKRLIFQALDKLSFSTSNKILFVSKSLLNNYISENIVDEKIAKVVGSGSFNGVNTDIFKPVSSEQRSNLRQKFGIPLDSFLICVVGRICADKGIKDIKKLVESLTSNNVKFIFVGGFEDGKNIVEKIVNDKQGYYMPHTSNIHEVFQCSNLHLFLSYREGFGNVAIEAASCGVPTFAYNVVGVKDSVNNDVSGQRFEFKDTSAIAQAINEAVDDTEFSKKYPAARDWVVENFEQRKVWKNYLDFYSKNL